MRMALAIALVAGVVVGVMPGSARADVAAGNAPPVDEAPTIMVVIDRSLTADKLAAVTGALAEAARAMPARTQLGVVLAGERPALDTALGSAPKARIRGVRGAARGDLIAALQLATARLAPLRVPRRRILVVTDGNDLLPIAGIAEQAHRANISVSAVGFRSLNRVTLQEIASGGSGRLFLADEPAQLTAAFAEAGALVPLRATPERQDIALAVVIDRSASLQGPGIEAAKETARVTSELLSPDDMITVIGFDTEAQTIVPVQHAANHIRISNEIAQIGSGNGTNLFAGLKAAQEALAGINARRKQVVFISDGDAPMDGVVELVQQMHAAKIEVTVVGVAKTDRTNLSAIADAANGRLYMVEDIGALPKIFMRDTQAPWSPEW